MSKLGRPEIKDLVSHALVRAQELHDQTADGGEVIKQGVASGDLNNDTEIKLDRVIGQAIKELLWAGTEGQANISVEGLDETQGSPENDLWFCVDPLDGSLNYQLKGNTIGLPYCTTITVLDRKKDATFSNVIMAANLDLRSHDLWFVEKKNGQLISTINGKIIKPNPISKIDLGSMPVIGEMYYPSNRALLYKAFEADKGYLRNPGSAAYEMASVASGQACAYVCDQQKQHEAGMGYAMIKGAGGVGVNFKMEDLADTPFLFNAKHDIIIASSLAIAKEIRDRIGLTPEQLNILTGMI